MVNAHSVFKETGKLFSRVVVSHYIPTSNVGEIVSSHPCQYLAFFLFI
jgi:hypothetical protein